MDSEMFKHLLANCSDPALAAQLAYILQHGELVPYVGSEPSKRSKRSAPQQPRGCAFFADRTAPKGKVTS